MKAALLEHIEAKIINYLLDVKPPIPASQIAKRIQETREDTLLAIHRLVKGRTIKGVQDVSQFNSTGETMAYVLIAPFPMPAPVQPPAPPSRLRA